MNAAEDVIARFGGEAALAVLIGKDLKTVLYWKQLGTIPPKWQVTLLKLAKEQGIPLAPSNFLAPSLFPAASSDPATAASTELAGSAEPATPVWPTSRWLAPFRNKWMLLSAIIASVAIVGVVIAAVIYFASPSKATSSTKTPSEQQAADSTANARSAPTQPASTGADASAQWSVYALHGNWKTMCPNGAGEAALKTACIGELDGTDSQSHRKILTWMVGHESGGSLIINLQVPTGLRITPGIGLQFDKGETRRLEYANCGPIICIATLKIDAVVFREAYAAKYANITISPYGRQPLTLRISTIGFGQVLDDLK